MIWSIKVKPAGYVLVTSWLLLLVALWWYVSVVIVTSWDVLLCDQHCFRWHWCLTRPSCCHDHKAVYCSAQKQVLLYSDLQVDSDSDLQVDSDTLQFSSQLTVEECTRLMRCLLLISGCSRPWSTAPQSAPTVLAEKTDDLIRLCIGYNVSTSHIKTTDVRTCRLIIIGLLKCSVWRQSNFM